MKRLKLATLHNLALHCGYPTQTTKNARIEAAKSYWLLLDLLPASPFKVLSIDVGIKNFSYCKLEYETPTPSPGNPLSAKVVEWNHLNLHDRFGPLYIPKTADLASPVDSKAYLAHLALSVVESVIACPEWIPSVITIENQRTRSNSNSATLPNVLLNFTLEHMIYAAFASRQVYDPRLKQTAIVPMNSNKMVNYWLTRFVTKSKITPAQSKILRTNLLYGWLSDTSVAPVTLCDFNLGRDFDHMKARDKADAFLGALSIHSRSGKVDDLVDCALYNFAYAKQLERHLELQKKIALEKDLAQLIDKWDQEHCNYLRPLLRKDKIKLKSEFLRYT